MVGPPYMTTNFYADVYFRKTPRSEEVHRIQFLYVIAGLLLGSNLEQTILAPTKTFNAATIREGLRSREGI